jgi:REP element-mobilizing transposase RayT
MKTTSRVSPKKSIKNQSAVPYNPPLQNLVTEKQAWSKPFLDENNFSGWHQRGYLPHRDEPGLTQLVTFRLYDSMPLSRRTEWESILKIEDVRDRRTNLERYFDRGAGECWLARPDIAKCAENALLYFNTQRYQLHAWVIMPNHIHIIVKIGNAPLAKLMQSWKQFISRESNKLLNRKGDFWQREYWDTYMRDENQMLTATKYIENNPVKANLVREPRDWPWSSARFRDQYGKLILPESVG